MKWLDNCLNLVGMSACAPVQKGLSSEQVYMLLEAVQSQRSQQHMIAMIGISNDLLYPGDYQIDAIPARIVREMPRRTPFEDCRVFFSACVSGIETLFCH